MAMMSGIGVFIFQMLDKSLGVSRALYVLCVSNEAASLHFDFN
jgi:hypothetical protein